MNKSLRVYSLWIAGLVLGYGNLPAQTISSEPSSTQRQPPYRLQTLVRRVYVDVVAIDARGHPVKGLREYREIPWRLCLRAPDRRVREAGNGWAAARSLW